MSCKCYINHDAGNIEEIVQCPLCKAAPQLLAACENCLRFCKGLVSKHPVAKVLKEELQAAIEAVKGAK